MYPTGKFQADSCGVLYSLHLARINKARRRLHLEREVLRGQSDLLAGWGWSLAPLGLLLREQGGLQECSVDLPSHHPAPANVSLYRGHRHLVLRDEQLVRWYPTWNWN